MKSNVIAIKNDLSHLKKKSNKIKSNKKKLFIRRNAKVYPLNLYYNKPNPTYNYSGLTNYKQSSTSMNSNYSFSNSDTVSNIVYNTNYNKQNNYLNNYRNNYKNNYNTFTTQNLGNLYDYKISKYYNYDINYDNYDNNSNYYDDSIYSDELNTKNTNVFYNKKIYTNNISNNGFFKNSIFTNNTLNISNLNNDNNKYHNLSWFKRLKNRFIGKNKVDNLNYNNGVYNRKKNNSDKKIVRLFYIGLIGFIVGICFI